MAHADYEALVRKFTNEPVILVKVSLPSPKTGNDDVYYFCSKDARPILHVQLGIDVVPCLIAAGGTGVKIEPDKIATWTSQTALDFFDPDDFEALDATAVDITDGPSLFQTLYNAYPDWHNSPVEVLHGFIDSSMNAVTKFEPQSVSKLTDWDINPDQTSSWTLEDPFDLEKEIEVPTPISDTNLLVTGVNNSTDNDFEPTFIDEFPDPDTDWPSVDWIGPVLVLNRGLVNEERVIYSHKAVSGTVLRCAQNWLADTEDFNPATTAWTGSGGTASKDEVFGPFGILNGSLFEGSGATLTWGQVTAHTVAGNRCFSMWLREHPDNPGITIRLTVKASGGGATYNNDVTLTDEWVRYEIGGDLSAGSGNAEVEFGYTAGGPYKFYGTQTQVNNGTTRRVYVWQSSTAGGLTAGRGAYGTSKQTHAINSTMTEMAEYRDQSDTTKGLNGVWVARDLLNRDLVPYSGFPTDWPTFQQTADVIDRPNARRTIEDPRDVGELLVEIQRESMIVLFGNKDGRMVCKPAFRPMLQTQTFQVLDGSKDFVEASEGRPALRIESNKESRMNVVVIHYLRRIDSQGILYPGDEPDHFTKHLIQPEPGSAGKNLRSIKFHTIFAMFIYRDEDAQALASNYLARFRKGARIVSGKVKYSRVLDFEVADTVQIEADRITTADYATGEAVKGAGKWQVTGIDYPAGFGDLEVTFLEAIQQRFAVISPAGWPDYDAAPEETKEYYGWIGRALDNKVPTALDEGYYISVD
jgi:hypothetical protein